MRPEFRLAHRLLDCSSVNDDCRLTDRPRPALARCKDRATYPRRPEQSSGPFPTKACASLSLIKRDRVIRGAKVEFAAPPMTRLPARPRARLGSHFSSARQLL